MAAPAKRDPGELEKRRAANGRWYTAGEEDDELMSPKGLAETGAVEMGWVGGGDTSVGGCGPSSGVYAHCLGRP